MILDEKYKFDDLEFENNFIRDIAHMALKNELKVYLPSHMLDKKISYFNFSNGGNWAYCELDNFYGVNLDTKYTPSRERGSGRRVYDMKENVSIDNLFRVLEDCNYDYNHYKCKPYNAEKDTLYKYREVIL